MQPPAADLILLLIALALASSATLSLFETAILSSQRHRIARMASEGRRGARLLLRLLDDIDGVLATILLWNNFANVAIASLATLLAVTLLGGSQTALSATSIATTLVILICAEITPKAIGVRYPETVACAAALVLTPLAKVSTPIVAVIRALVRALLRGFGAKLAVEPIRKVATDELLALVADRQAVREVTPSHRSMLVKLIGLHELSVDDLMIPRDEICFIDLQDSTETIIQELTEADHSIVPVCDGSLDATIGVLRTRKAIAATLEGRLDADMLRELAVKPLFVPATLDPLSALGMMVESKRELSLIVDEYGGLIGMVKVADFMRHLIGPRVEPGKDAGAPAGAWVVDSDEEVRELNLRYGISLPESGPRTIGGLIAAELNQFPEYPLGMEIGSVRLEVEAVDDRKLRILIHRPPADAEAD